MPRKPIQAGEHGRITTTPQIRNASGRWKTAGSARQAQRWRARCYLRDYDGSTLELSRVARTRSKANAVLQTAIAERFPELGELTPGMKITVAGLVWLGQVQRTDSGLSRETVDTYRRAWKRYIDAPGSRIRGLTLAEVNHPHRLRLFLQTVADTYGTGSAKTTRSVLAGIIRYAVDGGALTTNALRHVRQVRSQSAAWPGRRDMRRAFTRDERDTLLAHADALAVDTDRIARTRRKLQTAADLLAFLAGTGVRIGEARHLQWQHLNLAAGTVDIQGTKSRAARRRLNLPAWLTARLHARGDRCGTAGLVFPSPVHGRVGSAVGSEQLREHSRPDSGQLRHGLGDPAHLPPYRGQLPRHRRHPSGTDRRPARPRGPGDDRRRLSWPGSARRQAALAAHL